MVLLGVLSGCKGIMQPFWDKNNCLSLRGDVTNASMQLYWIYKSTYPTMRLTALQKEVIITWKMGTSGLC